MTRGKRRRPQPSACFLTTFLACRCPRHFDVHFRRFFDVFAADVPPTPTFHRLTTTTSSDSSESGS